MIKPRNAVLNVQPYPAPAEGRYAATRLDFNENTVGFPQCYPAGLAPETVSAYPEYAEFMNKAATVFGVGEDQLIATNGSDEALMLIAQTFVDANDIGVISKPCFAVMPQCLRIAGADLREVPVLADMTFDFEGLEKQFTGAKIAMFASPENPTGAVIEPALLQKWCAQFPDVLFVLDEAYGEYAGQTFVPLIQQFDNLLVMKTFSKAWGMAGLRLGLLFGQKTLIDFVKRVKLPYSVNTAATATALKLLNNRNAVFAAAEETMRRKEQIENQLRERGYTLVTGAANSFLLKMPPADCVEFAAFAKTKAAILVRPRDQSYVRISVGTSAGMEKLLSVLEQFEKSKGLQK